MHRKILPALLCCIVAVGLGCNTLKRQPQLRDAMIAPNELKPGDTAVITVRVSDRHGIVQRVEGVVKEDPRVKFKLHDDGKAPDAKANDSTWSMQVDVPFQAPPGEFTLEFTAYDSQDRAILVRSPAGGTVPLTSACKVNIRIPKE